MMHCISASGDHFKTSSDSCERVNLEKLPAWLDAIATLDTSSTGSHTNNMIDVVRDALTDSVSSVLGKNTNKK